MVQGVIVFLVVAAAGGYLALRLLRAARGREGCGGGCACAGPGASRPDRLGRRIELVDVTLRRGGG